MEITTLIDAVIGREGGYSNHPADRGGATRWGITEAVARAHGYRGDMRGFPREDAVAIYTRVYWVRPGFDRVAPLAPAIAAELFDTGVNMGPAVATSFLQRALNALNRGASDYPDIIPGASIDDATVAALSAYLARRKPHGETVLLKAIDAAGRTLPQPRRAPSGERGIPLRLAREPARLTARFWCDFRVNFGDPTCPSSNP